MDDKRWRIDDSSQMSERVENEVLKSEPVVLHVSSKCKTFY